MLMSIIWKKLSTTEQLKLLQRPSREKEGDFNGKVQDIIHRVRSQGDVACKEMTREFDSVDLASLAVQANEFDDARKKVSDATRRAMQRVIDQLYAFHFPQRLQCLLSWRLITQDYMGVLMNPERLFSGLVFMFLVVLPISFNYVMLEVPSQIANCPIRILCSPPNQQEGHINPYILVAAELWQA